MGRTLTAIKRIAAIAALILGTGNLAYSLPSSHEGSDDCYVKGHRIYLAAGLNYPRAQWASWGITCRAPKSEGVEGTGAAAGTDSRPAEWCGWWMRQHLGGHYGPEYDTARNWLNVGRSLPGPRPGALGVKAHHVFQVVRVVGPGQVLAISGNDHGAVRTRVRSTDGVLGWRDVAENTIATPSPTPKEESLVHNSTAPTNQVKKGTNVDGDSAVRH